MRIVLVSPKSTVRPMDSAWKTQMAPPLSLLVLGALTPRTHAITIEDENVERLLLSTDADLVGITVKVDTVRRAQEITRFYQDNGIPVVWGGIFPTMCPEQCVGEADSVVVGEAEAIWPSLLEDVEQGRLKHVYRSKCPVDTRQIPAPRWELLKGKNYLFTNTLRAGRGCPWRCEFCYNSSPNIDSRYRAKPVASILAEIESLGVPHVMFIDDNFIGDLHHARRLLARLRPMGLTWHAAVSADVGRHEDILDLMAESGCKSLFIGFETLNEGNLRACRKRQNQVKYYNATIAGIHQRGMLVNASLVFGFDDDNLQTFPTTLAWLVRNRVETMTAHILTPYPGTALYARLKAEGRITDTDLTHYNTAHVVFQPRNMTPEELEAGYRWMYDEFYSWENILNRWPLAAAQAVAYMEFNLLYRKFGKITCLLGRALGMRNMARLATALAYAPGRRSRRAVPATAEKDVRRPWCTEESVRFAGDWQWGMR